MALRRARFEPEPEPERKGRVVAVSPVGDLGTDPVSGAVVTLKEVRFGPLVTGGETSASLGGATW